MSDVASVAERAVRVALRAGADAAEAYASASRGMRFALERDEVDGGEAYAEGGLGLRALVAGRVGFAYTSRLGTSDLRRAAETAIGNSRGLAASRMRFPAARKAPRVAGLADRRVEGLGAAEGLEAVREMLRGAHEVAGARLVGGSFAWSRDEAALANSEGLSCTEGSTGVSAYASVVLERDEVSTGSEVRESRRLDVDGFEAGLAAARMAEQAQGARDLPRGRAPVVLLKPEPASSLLELLLVRALIGERMRRGESPYSGMLRKRVADRALTVRDDAREPGGLGSAARDDEGLPSRRLGLVERGLLRRGLYDLDSAARYDERPTGSGMRTGGGGGGFAESPGTQPRHVVVTVSGARPLERLIASVDRGVLVHEALGVHTANPATGDFSVTSSSAHWIERGALSHALKPVMLAGNLPRLLRKLYGASQEAKALSGDAAGAYTVPTVALEGVRVVA